MKTHWVVFHNDKLLLVNHGDVFALPSDSDILPITSSLCHQHQIGNFNNLNFYCGYLESVENLPVIFKLVNLRKGLEILGFDLYHAVTKGYTIINWDRNHQFCGRCAHETVHKGEIYERVCSNCGLAFYPRISPSVIVLIQRGNELLMARGPHFTPGAYGLVAGFVEAGENLEQTAKREVMEEVNVEITNLRYFASQPWPFPDSLMIGFIADYAGGELKIDNVEIEAAGWYRYDNLPGRPSSSVGIARKLVDYFVAQQEALNR